MTFCRIVSVAVATLFMLLPVLDKAWASDQSQENTCHWIGGGSHHAEFAKGGQRLTYRLSSKNETWHNAPFGWHSTGVLQCKDCVDGSPAAGMYNFTRDYASWLSKRPLLGFPKTAKQRIQRAYETIGYPVVLVSGKSLKPLSYRENIQLGRYAGYAVLFKVELTDAKHTARKSKLQGRHLLILSLTDGCLRFETTLHMQNSPEEGVNFVDSILSDISISYKSEPLDKATREQLEIRLTKEQRQQRSDQSLIDLMPKTE